MELYSDELGPGLRGEGGRSDWAGPEPGPGGGLQAPGWRLAGVYPFFCALKLQRRLLVPERGVGLLQGLHSLRPEVQALRWPRGRGCTLQVSVSFLAAYPGVTFAVFPTPHLSPPSSIPHPWHHPLHAGVLSITSTKCALGCLTFLLLLPPVCPPPPPPSPPHPLWTTHL